MSIAANMSTVLGSGLARTGLVFATGILLARGLTPEGRGAYALAVAAAAVTMMATHFGITASAIHALRSHPAAGSRRAAAGALIVVLAGLLAAVFWGGAALAGRTPPRLAAAELVAPMVAWVALGHALRYCAGLGRALGAYGVHAARDVVAPLAFLGLLVALALTGRMSARAALWAYVAAEALTLATTAAAIGRRLGPPERPRAADFRVLSRFGFKSWIQALAGQLQRRIDVLLVAGVLDDPAALAYYAIARGLVDQLEVVPNAMGQVVFREVAGRGAESAAQLVAVSLRTSMALVTPAALALAAFAPWLLPLLYGSQYGASLQPLLALLPGGLALVVFRMLSRHFAATARQQIPARQHALGIAVKVPIALASMPVLGLTGAALASSLAALAMAALALRRFIRENGMPIGEVLLVQPEDRALLRARVSRFRRSSPPAGKDR